MAQKVSSRKFSYANHPTYVPNKILWISVSFKLQYLIVAQLIAEILKIKPAPILKNHTV